MHIAQLPEELLREILRLLLAPPHAAFLRFPFNPSVPRWSTEWNVLLARGGERARPAGVLRVCKTWLRVGTPLLYACVGLWAPRHAAAVAALLVRETQLGRMVRCLRLEGGMGKELVSVARCAPNVRALYVSLHVKASESVVGLRKSVALLAPAALYIHGGSGNHNKRYFEAALIVERAVKDQWKQSLSSISLGGYFEMTAGFAKALSKASSLITIDLEPEHSFDKWIERGYLATICRSSSLQEIRYHGMRDQAGIEAKISRLPELVEEVAGRLRFVESADEQEARELFEPLDVDILGVYDP